jgi:hypothetical protein
MNPCARPDRRPRPRAPETERLVSRWPDAESRLAHAHPRTPKPGRRNPRDITSASRRLASRRRRPTGIPQRRGQTGPKRLARRKPVSREPKPHSRKTGLARLASADPRPRKTVPADSWSPHWRPDASQAAGTDPAGVTPGISRRHGQARENHSGRFPARFQPPACRCSAQPTPRLGPQPLLSRAALPSPSLPGRVPARVVAKLGRSCALGGCWAEVVRRVAVNRLRSGLAFRAETPVRRSKLARKPPVALFVLGLGKPF